MARGSLVRVAWLVTALVAGMAAPAYADGYVSGGFGVSFGSPAANGRANFVGDLGWLSREPIGVELDVTYAPSFFKNAIIPTGGQPANAGAFTENRLATVMGNVVCAGSARDRGRPRRRSSLRPYVSGGFGLMSARVATPDAAVSNEHLGIDLGVGLMAVSRQMLGIRADVRYFQDLVGTSSGTTSGIDFGFFHFWRASLGVVIAF